MTITFSRHSQPFLALQRYFIAGIFCVGFSACGADEDEGTAADFGTAGAGGIAGEAGAAGAGGEAGAAGAGGEAGTAGAGGEAGAAGAGGEAGVAGAGGEAGAAGAGGEAGAAGEAGMGGEAGGNGMVLLPPSGPCTPESSPEDEAPCTLSLYEAREPSSYPDDLLVVVEGSVTSLRYNEDGRLSHLTIQLRPEDPDYQGTDYSGLWIYTNNARGELPPIALGERLRLTGELNTFYDQRQLEKLELVESLGMAPALPLDIDDPASIATGGASAALLEGLLVRVSGVSVTELEPPAGPGDMAPVNEFVVDGALRVNDFIFAAPLPMVGDSFTSITGILRLGNGDYKLEPRSAEDLVR